MSSNNPQNMISHIQLYDDMTKIVTSSANLQKTGRGDGFFQDLGIFFDSEIMGDPANRQRTVELVSDLTKSTDLTKGVVLVDYAGTTHAQANLLSQGVEWLGKPENWASLSESQKALLGNNPMLFRNADVKIFVGVSSVTSSSNPLRGAGIPGVYDEVSPYTDIVEGAKSRFMNPTSLANGKIEYVPTSALDQAESWKRKLLILDSVTNP